MTRNKAAFAVAAMALLILAGCGSMGDIYGNNPYPNRSYDNEMRGTVDYVDVNNRSIVLTNVNGYDPMLSSSGSGNSVRVYYDNQTAVRYQGQNYRPEDLDRGDEVAVRVSQSGNRLIADTMTVTYNASNASSPNERSRDVSTIRGTVRYVDTAARTIQLEQTSWVTGFNRNTNTSMLTLSYDSSTGVEVSGQLYPVTNLERGDVVEVQAQDLGNSGLLAQRITLIRDVRR